MRTPRFSNILKVFLAVVFAATLSGCAAVGAGIGYAIEKPMADERDKTFPGVLEVGEIEMKPGVALAIVKMANVSSEISNKDMSTPNTSPRPNDTKVNTTVADEVKRSLDLTENSSSPVTIRLKTFYFDEGWPWGYCYYRGVSERKTLINKYGVYGGRGVRKAVNTHLTIEQGNTILLEVHGLWGGNDQADEIAGARQLAREVASEVLKKLSASSVPPPTVAEKQ